MGVAWMLQIIRVMLGELENVNIYYMLFMENLNIFGK